MPRSMFPLARTTNLIIQPIDQETMVYDTATDKAYVLNPTAAAVWRACNGQRTIHDIASYLSQETPTNELTVSYALGQMQELLQAPVEIPQTLQGISRRQFLKRAGLLGAAAVVPVVVSLVAPPPAHAQSIVFLFCCVCVDGFRDSGLGCAACSSVCQEHNGVSGCTNIENCFAP